MRKIEVTTCLIVTVIFVAAFPSHAFAYSGPGAGAGTNAFVLGVLASLFLAFMGILWYPLKRLLRRHKESQQSSEKKADIE